MCRSRASFSGLNWSLRALQEGWAAAGGQHAARHVTPQPTRSGSTGSVPGGAAKAALPLIQAVQRRAVLVMQAAEQGGLALSERERLALSPHLAPRQ